MNKKHLTIFTIISLFFILSINSQWRYPNYKNIKNDVIITYKVEYQNDLSIKQKESSRHKKEIIVFFNQDKLVEKTIKNTKGYSTFKLFDYTTEKFYNCYNSIYKKEAIKNSFKISPQKEALKIKGTKNVLGFDSQVFEILIGDEPKEVITTKQIGLRYIKGFNVHGFLLKYSARDKILGPYTVTAIKVDYAKIADNKYSLQNYIIKTPKEHKNYLAQKDKTRNKVKEKSTKKMNGKSPKFSVTTIDKEVLKSKKLLGKVIVINFFFLKSSPCRKLIPELNELKKKYKNKDVEFIAVSLDEEYKIKGYTRTNPFNFKLVEDGKWLAKKFDIDLYPTNIIIDKKGSYRYYKASYRKDRVQSMSFKIDELLKE